jgi:hypothetical protein
MARSERGVSGGGQTSRFQRRTTIFAIVLLVVFTIVPVLLGLYVAPWFFLVMVALIVVPFLFILGASAD